MKAIKFTSLLAIALALTFAATGCKKKPVGVINIPGTGTRVVDQGMKPMEGSGTYQPGDGVDGFGGGPQNADLQNLDNFHQDAEALKAYTIHFDLDSSVVKGSDMGNISAVAAYLKDHPGTSLLVEGNCDDRGTEEYNRALGERRALAGREAIVTDGVDGMRIRTLSNGEDRPVAFGNDESAWRQNRRDDFVVLTPK